ncbi:unnamed protein product [Adineta ricciae]|uniref:Uncharacterized protein n=1 Tax=Adineta ricciae TaxID=249248 RepID=A0A814SQE9_ADIRI|nr:unnamed protein product [Adineta ricciae]
METASKQSKSKSDENLNQITCQLKHAIFSKCISHYLINKVDEMWLLYEKQIDQILQDKHLHPNCPSTRSDTITKLEEFANKQQQIILSCQQDIDALCSSHLKHSVPVQSTSFNSIHVPKTPRCFNRLAFNFNTHL